jgi:nucleoside-diphosphate-sugar epimerase
MYPTDLVAWLLKAMIDPKPGHFNVGSESSISMAELASLISDLTSREGIEILNPEISPNNYVPSTKLFRAEFGVKESVPLSTGLLNWKSWLTSNYLQTPYRPRN